MSLLTPGALVAGRYRVGREIGRGGWSVVYCARDEKIDQDVALKLFVPPPAAAAQARERLRREVLAARDLVHENIVAVHDLIEDGEQSCIVMEYVPGTDLAIRVRERGPLPPEEAGRIGRGIALALSVAHRRGILHRDVKPQNILLGADGRARLADFGSARLDGSSSMTATGGLVGTLDYLAPEVLAGARGDARADVYALGLTLFFSLTGRLPERPSPHLPPPAAPDGYRPAGFRTDVPPGLDEIVARATAALPADRFNSAALLADALGGDQTGEHPIIRTAQQIGFCLLCGADDPLGLGLCTGCSSAAGSAPTALLFLDAADGPAARVHAREQVIDLAGGSAPRGALTATLRGERALARVPLAGLERVVERLAARGLLARVEHGRWVPLPRLIYLIAATMAFTGLAAGRLVLPDLLWVTPLMTALVVLEAQRQASRPLLTARAQSLELSPAAQARLAAAVSRLPSGTALTLLADLVRQVQSVRARIPPEYAMAREEIEALLLHACDAALDLAELDETLERLEHQRERAARPGEAWNAALARAERTRDALVQRMLDAISALGDARVRAIEADGRGAERLAALSEELRRELGHYAEARREVEAML